MQTQSLLHALLSTQSPLLPMPWLERLYLMLAWGVVLGALVLAYLRHRGQTEGRAARWLPLVALLWCLLPGAASPAYWLGLAFRAPSLLSALLCGWMLLRHHQRRVGAPVPLDALRDWAPAWALLGWILLLDVFAVWPLGVYGLGFAPFTLGVLVLLGLLPWLWHGRAADLSALLVSALLLHVLLRLPSGNVWDVLIDPWLWLLLQVDWLRRSLRRR